MSPVLFVLHCQGWILSKVEAFAHGLRLQADNGLDKKSEPRACRKDKHVTEGPSPTTEKGHRFGVPQFHLCFIVKGGFSAKLRLLPTAFACKQTRS